MVSLEKCISIVGIGRMGRVFAQKLADSRRLVLYDRDIDQAAAAAARVGACAAASLEEAAECGTVILAVPDREVLSCIEYFNSLKKELIVVNVATSVPQDVLEQTVKYPVRGISVKIIGHAGEMTLGMKPVIIVNSAPADLAEQACRLFAPMGCVITGEADDVATINTVAAEVVLEAAVQIENTLRRRGYYNSLVIRSAIGQVAAGVLKAYADDDLGPFAREIVQAVQAKLAGDPDQEAAAARGQQEERQ